MRLGLIGCGQIGRVHARRLAEEGSGSIGVLCDPLISNAEGIRREFFPEARITTQPEEVFSTSGLQGVIVASPTDQHVEPVEMALDRGLAVLCEKPLAESREKILRLIERANRPGSPPVVVGYQRRFWSSYRTLKREIDSGAWGKIKAIALYNSEDWMQFQALPGTWRNDPQKNPGGYIGDAGSHKIDILQHLTGRKPIKIYSQIDFCGRPIPIRAIVSGRLDGGIPLALSLYGDANHFREDLVISMEGADLVLRDREIWIARNKTLERIEDLEPDSDATLGFVDILEGKLDNPAPAECALAVWDFTAAILESDRLGEPVELS